MTGLYRRRRAANSLLLACALSATLIGLFWLAAILFTLLYNGIAGLSLQMFIEATPPPGSAGGLANAIFGSVVMTILGTLLGAPIGILAGTFLAEYSHGSRIAAVVRFINDILLSAPSIIVGLFVYEIMVIRMGHFSAWAGAVALALIVLPVVIRTSEDMLNLVPNALREASAALGAPRWKTITMVCYRAALQGLLTGHHAGHRAGQRRDRPTALHGVEQSVLDHQSGCSDGKPAGGDFPVRAQPLSRLAAACLGGALLITFTILGLNIGARALASRVGTKKGA